MMIVPTVIQTVNTAIVNVIPLQEESQRIFVYNSSMRDESAENLRSIEKAFWFTFVVLRMRR